MCIIYVVQVINDILPSKIPLFIHPDFSKPFFIDCGDSIYGPCLVQKDSDLSVISLIEQFPKKL